MTNTGRISLGGIGATVYEADHLHSAHVRVTVTSPDGTTAETRLSPYHARALAVQLIRLSYKADPEDRE